MTKRTNSKAQAKHLKKRSERKTKAAHYRTIGINAHRDKKVEAFSRQTVANLLARGQVINGSTLTVEGVMMMINQTIETNAGVGSVVEFLEILEKEGKLTLTEEDRKLIDSFDEDVVKFNENAEAVTIILQGETNLDIMPPELVMDLGFRSERLVTEFCPAIMAMADPYREMVETYGKEHYPDRSYREVMFSVAIGRLKRIQPKYATPVSVEAEEPDADEAQDINDVLDTAQQERAE